MLNLNDFKKNVRSQGGEDGIIEKLLLEANIQTGYFVEFGAWDGRYLSNTCALADKGWGGCSLKPVTTGLRTYRETMRTVKK